MPLNQRYWMRRADAAIGTLDDKPVQLPFSWLRHPTEANGSVGKDLVVWVVCGDNQSNCLGLPSTVIQKRLGNSTWIVYLKLLLCRNALGDTHVTVKTLNQPMGLLPRVPRRTVQRALARLHEIGILEFPPESQSEWFAVRKAHPALAPYPGQEYLFLRRRVVFGGVYRHGGDVLVCWPKKVMKALLERPAWNAKTSTKRGQDFGAHIGGTLAPISKACHFGAQSLTKTSRQDSSSEEEEYPGCARSTFSEGEPKQEGAALMKTPPGYSGDDWVRGIEAVSFAVKAATILGLWVPGVMEANASVARLVARPPQPPQTTSVPPQNPSLTMPAPTTPEPPKLIPSTPPAERVATLCSAYRMVYGRRGRGRSWKKCFVGQGAQRDVTRLRGFRGLAAVAEKLVEYGIPPIRWALYSFDQWRHVVTDKMPPAMGWVFNLKRLETDADICANNFHPMRIVRMGAAQKRLLRQFDAMWWVIRRAESFAGRPLDAGEKGMVVDVVFPSGTYELMVDEARREIDQTRLEMGFSLRRGEWIWD